LHEIVVARHVTTTTRPGPCPNRPSGVPSLGRYRHAAHRP
jgi:hypothetical protein